MNLVFFVFKELISLFAHWRRARNLTALLRRTKFSNDLLDKCLYDLLNKRLCDLLNKCLYDLLYNLAGSR